MGRRVLPGAPARPGAAAGELLHQEAHPVASEHGLAARHELSSRKELHRLGARPRQIEHAAWRQRQHLAKPHLPPGDHDTDGHFHRQHASQLALLDLRARAHGVPSPTK